MLLKVLILISLVACNSVGTTQQGSSSPQSTKNDNITSKADRVKDGLVVPAMDALSFQLEKAGYNTYVLNQLTAFLKENSITEFLETNPAIKEIEKMIESGKRKPIKRRAREAQEVFETF